MENTIKIVTWNCEYSAPKDKKFLSKLQKIIEWADADVYIMQECPNPSVKEMSDEISNILESNDMKSPLWIGHKRGKTNDSCLWIFAKNNITLSELEHESADLEHYIFCKVNDFNILGIWAYTKDKKGYYAPMLWEYLKKNQQRIDANCIIAGDLNFDKYIDRNADNVDKIYKLLNDKKLISAYHKQTGEPFGKGKRETEKTYYDKSSNPSSHIDYLFATSDKIICTKLGTRNEWRNSDHVPVLV